MAKKKRLRLLQEEAIQEIFEEQNDYELEFAVRYLEETMKP